MCIYVCTTGIVLKEIIVFVLGEIWGNTVKFSPSRQIKGASLFLALFSPLKETVSVDFFFRSPDLSYNLFIPHCLWLSPRRNAISLTHFEERPQNPGECSFLEDTCAVGVERRPSRFLGTRFPVLPTGLQGWPTSSVPGPKMWNESSSSLDICIKTHFYLGNQGKTGRELLKCQPLLI